MIITKTPLRISLLGGNTDFPKYFDKYGGAVLTTTIDKYVYCIIKERFDDQIWLNWSIKEKVTNVNRLKHELVREAMKLVGVMKGVEITFLSDIPAEGSGLGSSSAVTVGVLNALHTYKGESVTARQLAEEACEIEINILKKPIGYQDQYAVAFGGFNLIEFTKHGVEIFPIIGFDSDDLLLFYTGITRKANKVLSKMVLDKKILDKNKELVYKVPTGALGASLHTYWGLKKMLNKWVTNKEIDKMYFKALAAGATGGKIVGAGAGGFLLLEAKGSYGSYVRAILKDYRELKFNFSKYGSQVIFNI